jgi:multisubunit Na+/H+ antiporter MnhG subunit
LIILFVLATNPTATHAMAKSALHGGQGPRDEASRREANGGETPSRP